MSDEGRIIAGKYELLRKIAQGGMAEVYLCKQRGLQGFEKLVVLKRMDLGLAYPLMSLGYIATFALGVWCFHEPASFTRILGIAVIIAGVVLLTRPA